MSFPGMGRLFLSPRLGRCPGPLPPPGWVGRSSAPAGLPGSYPAGLPPRNARMGRHLTRPGQPIPTPQHPSAPAPRLLCLGPSGQLWLGRLRIFLAGMVGSQAGLPHRRSPLAGIAWPGLIPSVPGRHSIDRETAPELLAPGQHARQPVNVQRYFSGWIGPGGTDRAGLFVRDAVYRSWDALGSDRYAFQSVLSSGGG
jgi:hypothetical protein